MPDLITYPAGGTGSTEFPGSALEAGWSFVDPIGGASLTVEDGKAKITLPTGTNYDPGTGSPSPGGNATRIERAQADEDFDIVVAFSSLHEAPDAICGHGIYFRCTDDSTARHDVYAQGNCTTNAVYSTGGNRAYVERRSAGQGTYGTIPIGYCTHLRLTRSGDDFTFAGSLDGTNWTTIATYTEDCEIEAIGVYGLTSASSDGYVCEIEYVHTLTDLPAVAGEASLVRTVLIDEDFSSALDSGVWDDDSVTSGTIVVSAGVATFTVANSDGSAARMHTVATMPANVGVLMKVRDPSDAAGNIFLAIGVGDSATGWASQYGAVGHAFEAGGTSATTRMVKLGVGNGSCVDGGYWSYPKQYTATALPLVDDWTWIRYECVGPVIRARSWADGDPEPSSWEAEYVNFSCYDRDQVGVAASRNNSSGASGAFEIESIQVYEIEAAAGGASFAGSLMGMV